MERAARKTYLDAVRLFACFGVVYNHVFGYTLFDAAGMGGALAQFLFFLSKPAVPLFFMISGTLLLSRVDTYRKTGVRILRMALVLILMCAFYWIVRCMKTGEAFTLGKLLASIYVHEPPDTNVFWFLYCYLGILVMLPVLQRLAVRMTKRDFQYLLLLTAVAAGILPITQKLWQAPPFFVNVNASVFYPYIGMMALGLYIERYTQPDRRGMLAAGVCALLLTAVCVALTRLDAAAFLPNGNLFYDDRTFLPIVGAAACFFYIAKGAFGRADMPERTRTRIGALGRLVFCVYLFCEFCIGALLPVQAWLIRHCTAYGGRLLYTFTVCIVTGLAAAALVRVPWLNRLL